MYWKATGETATREKILSMMEEVEKGSVLGRLIGGGTAGVAELFKDMPDVAALVTKPSVVQEEQFKVHLDKLYQELQDMDDMELLYRQVFVLENLGFCISPFLYAIHCSSFQTHIRTNLQAILTDILPYLPYSVIYIYNFFMFQSHFVHIYPI